MNVVSHACDAPRVCEHAVLICDCEDIYMFALLRSVQTKTMTFRLERIHRFEMQRKPQREAVCNKPRLHVDVFLCVCAPLLSEKETERAEGELGTMDGLSPRATRNCCQVWTATLQPLH